MTIERGRVYMGPAGRVAALPMLKRGQSGDPSPNLFGGVFTAIDGTPSKVVYGVRRAWKLAWNEMRSSVLESSMGRVEALYRGHMRRRAWLVDTRRRNLLNPVVASCTDTDEFFSTGTITRNVAGVLTTDVAEYLDGYLTWNAFTSNVMAYNPNFATDLLSWVGAGGTMTRVATGGPTGPIPTFSRIAATGGVQVMWSNTAGWQGVANGEPHTVTYWARGTSAGGFSSIIDWYSDGYNYLSSTTNSDGAASGTWTQYTSTHTPPAGTYQGKIKIRSNSNPTAAANIDMTGVSIVPRQVLRGRRAIPVISGSDYLFSAYVLATGGSVTPYVRLYDLGGAWLSNIAGSVITPSTVTRTSLAIPSASLTAAGSFDVGFAPITASALSTVGWQVQVDDTLKAYAPGAGSAEVIVSDYSCPYTRDGKVSPTATFSEV